MEEMLLTSVIWFVSAVAAFSALVVVLFRSGAVRESRDERGELKRGMSWKGLLPLVLFALVIMAMLFWYDKILFAGNEVGFWVVLLWNGGMLLALTLYDSFVIDLLVIGKWRPKFLSLPDTMDMAAMKEHVKKTFISGWVFIIPLTVIPSILFYVGSL